MEPEDTSNRMKPRMIGRGVPLALRTRQTIYPRPNQALPDFVKHTAGFALIQHELKSRPISAKESPRFYERNARLRPGLLKPDLLVG